VLAPAAFEYSLQKANILALRMELSGKREVGEGPLSPKEEMEKRRAVIDAHRALVGLPPLYARQDGGVQRTLFVPGRWDNEAWQELASASLALARDLQRMAESAQPTPGLRPALERARREVAGLVDEAERAARHAVALNGLRAQNHLTLGRVLLAAGKGEEAIRCLERAAQLYPSIPRSWFELAEAVHEVEGLTQRACAAYARAKALNVRETDEAGRLLRGQYHARNLLDRSQNRRLRQRLSECAGR